MTRTTYLMHLRLGPSMTSITNSTTLDNQIEREHSPRYPTLSRSAIDQPKENKQRLI